MVKVLIQYSSPREYFKEGKSEENCEFVKLATFRSEYEYDFQISNQLNPWNCHSFPLFTSR